MEDRSGPLCTTADRTGMAISGLGTATQYGFIVQARDGSGSTDGNLIERTVVVP